MSNGPGVNDSRNEGTGHQLGPAASDSETPIPEPEDEMIYWAKLADKAGEIDHAKIKRVKEDMDIVLIFAGLFSAVLTTFIVASFPNLQEDDSDTTVQLLRQLVSQGLRNVTDNGEDDPGVSALLNPPPFSPPASAISVNVLWFASLIMTLSAASFAFLIQQWLREYLNIDYDNPRARLRIREFRHQGLVYWRVFEIASSLPLLLQLALALFYSGLCVYTLSVHPSVGWTSIPMVTVWAFLFILATLMPLASARCPYRTSLLPDTVKKLRKAILRRHRLASTSSWTYLSGNTMDDEFEEFEEDRGVPLEEDEIALTSSGDLRVLYSEDIVRLHEASYTAKLGLLFQKRIPTAAIFRFFLTLIEYHLPSLPPSIRGSDKHPRHRDTKSPLIDDHRLLDLTPLALPVWEGLFGTAKAFVDKYVSDRSSFQNPTYAYTERAILILFAKSSHSEIPRRVKELRRELLALDHPNHREIYDVLAGTDFLQICSAIETASKGSAPKTQAKMVKEILRRRAVASPPQDQESMIAYVSRQKLSASDLGGILFVLEAELGEHIPNLQADNLSRRSGTSIEPLREVLRMTFSEYGKVAQTAFEAVFNLLKQPKARELCLGLGPDDALNILQSISRCELLGDGFMKVNRDGRRSILDCMRVLLKTHAGIAKRLGPVDVVRLTRRLLPVLRGTEKEVSVQPHQERRQLLWLALYQLLIPQNQDPQNQDSRTFSSLADYKDTLEEFWKLAKPDSPDGVTPPPIGNIPQDMIETLEKVISELNKHKNDRWWNLQFPQALQINIDDVYRGFKDLFHPEWAVTSPVNGGTADMSTDAAHPEGAELQPVNTRKLSRKKQPTMESPSNAV